MKSWTTPSLDPWSFVSAATIRKFWDKVEVRRPDDCWLWQAGKSKGGYGKFAITTGHPRGSGRPVQVHVRAPRFSLAVQKGSWPLLPALHRCDNPPCVNPAHLREGTQSENILEAFAKGRKRVMHTLSEDLKDDVRDLFVEGASIDEILELWPGRIGRSTVYKLTRGLEIVP